MKKIMLAVLIVSVSLGAVGCSKGEAETQDDAFRLDDSFEKALSVQAQLMLGTLKLEDTELAIDGEQAQALTPLWKALRSLVSSDTAAEAEVAAVLEQIQATMAEDQVEAIATMRLTEDDIFSTMQELALSVSGLEAFGEGGGLRGGEFPEGFTPPEGSIPDEGGRPGGGPEGGFNPGDGGGGFAGGLGQGLSPEQRETLRAERGAAGRPGIANRIGLFLMEPFIAILEAKADAE